MVAPKTSYVNSPKNRYNHSVMTEARSAMMARAEEMEYAADECFTLARDLSAAALAMIEEAYSMLEEAAVQNANGLEADGICKQLMYAVGFPGRDNNRDLVEEWAGWVNAGKPPVWPPAPPVKQVAPIFIPPPVTIPPPANVTVPVQAATITPTPKADQPTVKPNKGLTLWGKIKRSVTTRRAPTRDSVPLLNGLPAQTQRSLF